MPAVTGGGLMVLDGVAPFLGDAWSTLAEEHGMRVAFCKPKTHDEFLAVAEEIQAKVIVSNYDVTRDMGSYTPSMIKRLAEIGVIAVCHEGAGYDVIGNVYEWKKYGVQVSNCPNSVAPDTANTGIFLMLSAMRNFYPSSASLRAGKWRDSVPLGISPFGRTLGIFGMGNIGRMFRDRAKPFGFEKIQYYGRNRLAPELELDSEYVSDLDQFLATTDVLVLVLPLNAHTRHTINAERLKKCKDGVVIVNIARGPIIDEAALVDALNSGKVSSVGLDVYENEPEIHPGLMANQKIALLPHVGPLTDGTRVNLGHEIYANVKSILVTGSVVNLVPELR